MIGMDQICVDTTVETLFWTVGGCKMGRNGEKRAVMANFTIGKSIVVGLLTITRRRKRSRSRHDYKVSRILKSIGVCDGVFVINLKTKAR